MSNNETRRASVDDLDFENPETCPNCGHFIGGDKTCPNCGVMLGDEDELNVFEDDPAALD
jgi:ribosomal protein L32